MLGKERDTESKTEKNKPEDGESDLPMVHSSSQSTTPFRAAPPPTSTSLVKFLLTVARRSELISATFGPFQRISAVSFPPSPTRSKPSIRRSSSHYFWGFRFLLQICFSLICTYPQSAMEHEIKDKPKSQMFDDIIFISKGALIAYQGPVKKVEAYFAGIGIMVRDRVNPPVHFIDVLEGMVPVTSGSVTIEQLPVRWMLHNGYSVPEDICYMLWME